MNFKTRQSQGKQVIARLFINKGPGGKSGLQKENNFHKMMVANGDGEKSYGKCHRDDTNCEAIILSVAQAESKDLVTIRLEVQPLAHGDRVAIKGEKCSGGLVEQDIQLTKSTGFALV